jgi:hypothetical protein
MSKNTNLESIALEDLATITGGGFFGDVFGSGPPKSPPMRGPARPDPWTDALHSGKTLDVLQRNHGVPSWRWR